MRRGWAGRAGRSKITTRRARCRAGPPKASIRAFARMKMALLCALRGNIILYNGEELGLDQVEIPFEMVKDPEALKNRSEEHTSELQSLMRISYAVFCLKKKNKKERTE